MALEIARDNETVIFQLGIAFEWIRVAFPITIISFILWVALIWSDLRLLQTPIFDIQREN